MAHIIVLDEGTKSMRYKVMYEVFSLDGKRARKSKTFPAGTMYRTVEQFKRKVEYEYENGGCLVREGEKKGLKELCDEYFTVYAVNLSPTTVRMYKSMCYADKDGFLSYFNPDLKISKVSMTHLQGYLNHLADCGYAKKSIGNRRGFLSVLFGMAKKVGYIEENPARDLILPFNSKQKEEEKFMDIELAKHALELSAAMGGNYETVEWLGLLAGLRKGEMAGLKFENIFVKDGMSEIHIVETRIPDGNRVITKSPKSTAGKRVVQIPEILAEMLRRKKREYDLKRLKGGKDFQDEGFVFCNSLGTVLHPDTLYRHHYRFMQMLLKKYPEAEYVKLHGLRHSYASAAVASGMSIKSLMSQLGHSEVKMTMNLYAHAMESSKKEDVQRINQIFRPDEEKKMA